MPFPPQPMPGQTPLPPNAALFAQGLNTPPGAPASAGALPPGAVTPPGPGMPQAPMGPQGPIPPHPGMYPPNSPQGHLAAQGRMGDTLIAHLTPGEITVPPQVQTPQVKKAIDKAFAQNHIDTSQFTAGSPTSSINPATSMPEYNFWSSFLPVALGIGGSLIMPGIGTELGLGLSGLTASAIGGGVGTMAGNLLGGNSLMNSLMAGGLAGVGSYGLGSLLSPAASSATGEGAKAAASYVGSTPEAQVAQDVAAEGATPMGAPATGAATGATTGARSLSDILANPGGGLSMLAPSAPQMSTGQQIGTAGGAGLGAFVAGSMFPSTTSSSGPALPPGFTDHAPSVSSLPSGQQQLGMSTYNGPLPSFAGYNPITTSPGAYNFYPNGNPGAAAFSA